MWRHSWIPIGLRFAVFPGFGGVEFEGAGVEGLVAVFVWEGEALAACALVESVVEEFAAQGVGDGDASFAGAAFGWDESGLAVPALADVDEVVVEVYVVPLEGLEFAEAESGVEGGGIDGAVGGLEGVEERPDLGWGCDPFPFASDDREH